MGSAVVRVGSTSHVSHVGNLGWPRCSLLPGFNACRRRRRQTTMPQLARRDGLRAYPTSLRIVKVTSTRALMFPWWSPTLPTRTDSQPALCVALTTVAQPSVMHFPHQRLPRRRRRRRRFRVELRCRQPFTTSTVRPLSQWHLTRIQTAKSPTAVLAAQTFGSRLHVNSLELLLRSFTAAVV